jgi:hypothetical protein
MNPIEVRLRKGLVNIPGVPKLSNSSWRMYISDISAGPNVRNGSKADGSFGWKPDTRSRPCLHPISSFTFRELLRLAVTLTLRGLGIVA